MNGHTREWLAVPTAALMLFCWAPALSAADLDDLDQLLLSWTQDADHCQRLYELSEELMLLHSEAENVQQAKLLSLRCQGRSTMLERKSQAFGLSLDQQTSHRAPQNMAGPSSRVDIPKISDRYALRIEMDDGIEFSSPGDESFFSKAAEYRWTILYAPHESASHMVEQVHRLQNGSYTLAAPTGYALYWDDLLLDSGLSHENPGRVSLRLSLPDFDLPYSYPVELAGLEAGKDHSYQLDPEQIPLVQALRVLEPLEIKAKRSAILSGLSLSSAVSLTVASWRNHQHALELVEETVSFPAPTSTFLEPVKLSELQALEEKLSEQGGKVTRLAWSAATVATLGTAVTTRYFLLRKKRNDARVRATQAADEVYYPELTESLP